MKQNTFGFSKLWFWFKKHTRKINIMKVTTPYDLLLYQGWNHISGLDPRSSAVRSYLPPRKNIFMSKFPFLPWNLSSKRKSQWLDSIIYYCFNNTCYLSDKMMYQLQSGHWYYHARYSLFCRRGFVQNYENYNSKKSWTKFLAFVNLFDGAISYLTCYSSMTIKSRLLPL